MGIFLEMGSYRFGSRFFSQKMMASLGENDQILASMPRIQVREVDIPYSVCLHCDLLAHLIFNRNENEINLSKIM